MKNRKAIKAGRNIGAVGGAVFFLLFGLLPGFYFGSYVTLVLLSAFNGGPVEPTIATRLIVIVGSILGVVSTAALCIALGALAGTALSYAVEVAEQFREAIKQRKKIKIIPRPVRLTDEQKNQVLQRIGFLAPYKDGIHSIVLIGSTAYNLNSQGSDIDIVIICKKDRYEQLREIIFEKEIEGHLNHNGVQNVELIVLEPQYTESLFKIASPFAYSIRYGAVLQDDGYLSRLCSKELPLLPGRKYFLKALYEYIAVQYYGALTRLEQQIKHRNCSSLCCEFTRGCTGLSAADTFAKVIFRMLYVTLPARGYMPLCKADVLSFTREVYGEQGAQALESAINILRQNRTSILYNEYRSIKPFATELFKEVLGIVGIRKDVLNILKDAANMVRGDVHKIQDQRFRQCII